MSLQVIKDTLVEPVVQDVLKKAWDSKGPAAFSLDQLKPVRSHTAFMRTSSVLLLQHAIDRMCV